MKASVVYKNHEIVLDRTVTKTALYIDGIEVDHEIGIFERDKNRIYRGCIENDDGALESVSVEFICGFPKNVMNTVTFKVDDKLISKTEVL